MITTVTLGNNADLFPKILELYAKDGDNILDMTYGNGVFCKKVNKARFNLQTNDLINEKADWHEDFRDTSWGDNVFDIVVLDPPYMRTNNKAGIMASFYENQTINLKTHEDILTLYIQGIEEAKRILAPEGYLFIKCQDETESGKQRWTHIELMDLPGFTSRDLFILARTGQPMQGRCQQIQRSARKMHSYMIIQQKNK